MPAVGRLREPGRTLFPDETSTVAPSTRPEQSKAKQRCNNSS